MSALLGKPEEGFFMSKRNTNSAAAVLGDVTSSGVPWSELPDWVLERVEWMDGRHGAAKEPLPSIDEIPIPAMLFILPCLHEDRPRGSKAMLDVHGAKLRLSNCRPGAWVLSPFTGWQWAKWPNGEVGWVPANVALPLSLRVLSRSYIQ
jgi:hypothetical protein